MINYRETELLLSEIPFLDSYIQDIRESDFHSFTMNLFNKDKKAFSVYFEIATENSHFSMTSKVRPKSRKAQRFTQLLKSRTVGARIVGVHQLKYDRAFTLALKKEERMQYILFRFYSGPGANVILYDEENTIIDAMFRRPKRNEVSGEKIEIAERTEEPEKEFPVRKHPDGIPFNSFIDSFYDGKEKSERIDSLKEKIEKAREREIREIERNIRRAEDKIEATKDYEGGKYIADMLSSNLYQVKKGMSEIYVDDYSASGKLRIPLKPELTPRENLENFYKSYQKDKTAYSLALESLEKEKARLKERSAYYDELLNSDDIKKLRSIEENESSREKARRYHGPSFISGGFTLIVGRNSKENDEILRHDARGNDIWLHVRDFSGGYVIIKCQKDKEIPDSVILDAAHLAMHYSKAKGLAGADLYYTRVKYLRRAKDGKQGLVIPTQEKNIYLRYDGNRMDRILGERID